MSLEEQLSEGFEGRDGILNKFSDVEGLARSYQELQRNMGGSVRIPAPEASREEHEQFYQRLGAPETPEGYEVQEGMEEWAEGAKGIAHNARLTQDQWHGLMDAQRLHDEQADSAMTQQLESAVETLRVDYGDNYEGNLELAKVAIDALSEHSPSLSDSLKEIDLRDGAAFELFGLIGGLLSEGSTPEEMSHGDYEETSDVENAVRCRELMRTKAFTDKKDPEHEKTVREYYAKFKVLLEKGYDGVSDPRLKSPSIF